MRRDTHKSNTRNTIFLIFGSGEHQPTFITRILLFISVSFSTSIFVLSLLDHRKFLIKFQNLILFQSIEQQEDDMRKIVSNHFFKSNMKFNIFIENKCRNIQEQITIVYHCNWAFSVFMDTHKCIVLILRHTRDNVAKQLG